MVEDELFAVQHGPEEVLEGLLLVFDGIELAEHAGASGVLADAAFAASITRNENREVFRIRAARKSGQSPPAASPLRGDSPAPAAKVEAIPPPLPLPRAKAAPPAAPPAATPHETSPKGADAAATAERAPKTDKPKRQRRRIIPPPPPRNKQRAR